MLTKLTAYSFLVVQANSSKIHYIVSANQLKTITTLLPCYPLNKITTLANENSKFTTETGNFF